MPPSCSEDQLRHYEDLSPVGVRGEAILFCTLYSYALASGLPSLTTGTPLVVPRLMMGLLDVRRKSFVDLLTKAGLAFSVLFENVTPDTSDPYRTLLLLRL